MSTYSQRDIVLVPFPFSDLSHRKVRPVLIVSNDEYNQRSSDVVVCGPTTNLAPAPCSVLADTADVEDPGTLRHKSRIKVSALASLGRSVLTKRVARLRPRLFTEVIAAIHDRIRHPQ